MHHTKEQYISEHAKNYNFRSLVSDPDKILCEEITFLRKKLELKENEFEVLKIQYEKALYDKNDYYLECRRLAQIIEDWREKEVKKELDSRDKEFEVINGLG